MSKRPVFYLLILLFTLLTGCEENNEQQKRIEAENMVYAAYKAKDYPRIITLADSS